MIKYDHSHDYGCKMLELSASHFKTHCLTLMDQVADNREPLLITKHGKPVAKLVPITPQTPSLFGLHAGQGSEAPDFDPAETTDEVWLAEKGVLL